MAMKNGTATLQDSLVVLYKIKQILAYNLATTVLGIYPNRLKTYYVHKMFCMQVFVEAIIISAKSWKQ